MMSKVVALGMIAFALLTRLMSCGMLNFANPRGYDSIGYSLAENVRPLGDGLI